MNLVGKTITVFDHTVDRKTRLQKFHFRIEETGQRFSMVRCNILEVFFTGFGNYSESFNIGDSFKVKEQHDMLNRDGFKVRPVHHYH